MADILAICDKEPVFVQIFAEYLRKKFKTEWEVQAFDKADRFLQMAEEHRPQLSLIGEGMLDSYQLQKLLECSQHVIFLSTKRRKDMLFKYQSVERLTGELLRYCEEREIPIFGQQGVLTKRKDVKLIAFYAPAHHMLQSTLALTMGQIISKERKVLYLNFEPYSAFDYLLQRTYENDLMDIFFFLQEEKSKFRIKSWKSN